MVQLTDESPMPWGKFEGDKMIDVDASYLLWCYDNEKHGSGVKEYVEDNMDALKKEVRESK